MAGHRDPFSGVIAAEKGTAIRVPEILRDKMPHIDTAVYVRIALDDKYAGIVFPGTEVRVVIP